jgi:hypothetical protein
MNTEELVKQGGITLLQNTIKNIVDFIFRRKESKDSEIKTMLEAMSEQIITLNNKFNGLTDRIDALSGNVNEISCRLTKFELDKEAKKDLELFRFRVNQIATATIGSYDLNTTMQGMILAGAEMVGKLFSEVLSNNINDLDIQMLQIKSIAALKTIRSSYTVGDTDKEFATRIKQEIAYVLMGGMIRDLKELKADKYSDPQEINSKIKEIAFGFTKQFIDHSIRIYNECNN